MLNTVNYESPLGTLALSSNGTGLTGIWFCGSKYFPQDLNDRAVLQKDAVLDTAEKWLDIYFSGEEPQFSVPLSLSGTPFCMQVWDCLMKIPYGQTVTYKDIARTVAEKRGLAKMSAQAVGNAVGKNPVSIIVPCHRVIGSDGSLVGYAAGVDIKRALLTLETAL